jgi:hypothetical protein
MGLFSCIAFTYSQNIHLVKKWLPALEKKLEHYSQGSHPDYRVFMSAEPAATPAAHIIPQVYGLSFCYRKSSAVHCLVKGGGGGLRSIPIAIQVRY